MKRILVVCRAAALAAVCVGWAGAQQVGSADAKSATPSLNEVRVDPGGDLGGVDVLSDTQGVDFQPYLKGIMKQIYEQWAKLLPEDARRSQLEQGVTLRFAIDPDGAIAAMHMEASAKDDALNRAAWGAITGVGRFPALPVDFHGQNLTLRIHFRVNG